ncbi:MAG: FKBP-type peptidyl-prolyl cis-trans isomerase N-terminal domain-containing protein, partial [Muribaculaceae bacterium]|nr:FKBP-type peptidyl-prolyl cis-trans isomerase N-terminal domain-containing protein [Muribaculaceae bacterium]
MAGFVSGIKGNGLMTVDSAQNVAQVMMQAIKAKEMEKTYGGNKEAGEKFLA